MSSPVRQAGAIAVRLDRKTPRFLLVTARRNSTRWIFPKGKIEPGERAEEAAVRELAEEAGFSGRVLGRVGTLRFEWDGEDIRVQYFLVEALKGVQGREPRQRKWLRLEEARKRLHYADTRRLLDKAAARVSRLQ
jgi:8-oxo-dGTP diphosphatase